MEAKVEGEIGRCRKGLRAEEHRRFLDAGTRDWVLLGASGKEHSRADTWVLGLWPPELWSAARVVSSP